MKTILLLATATTLHAGSPTQVAVETPTETPWLVPTLDARLRYEFPKVQTSLNDLDKAEKASKLRSSK
jgi:hypothetical protein